MPLPFGFRCHKQYVFELDQLKTRIAQTTRQIETCHAQLLAPSSGDPQLKLMAELNQCLTSQQNLQASLHFLLTHIEPIDAQAFHAKCSALIDRRMVCLEARRMLQIRALLLLQPPP